MIVNCVKLAFITILALNVGACRSRLSSDINHGHLTLRHALLQGWDVAYETPPNPATTFALYSIEDFKKRINFSVAQYYNIHTDITGVFQRLGHDKLSLEFDYFQTNDNNEIVAKSITFDPGSGLTNTTENGIIKYSYNVTEDLQYLKLEDVLHRVLHVNIRCSLHSVRVRFDENRIKCFAIAITVSFEDDDHNGQVCIDMQTNTVPISCGQMDLTVEGNERHCPQIERWLICTCLVITSTTVIVDGLVFLFSSFVLLYIWTTKGSKFKFTKLSYFFKLWLILSLTGDGLILNGTNDLKNAVNDHSETVALPSYDNLAFYIGMGCLIGWISILRFLKINVKFSLLFHTLYDSFGDVIAFIACAAVLFFGFLVCAFVSLGAYHVKFASQESSAESLFSLINGDDVYNTFASLNAKLAGDPGKIKLHRNIIVYSFVVLFTIIMLNLIIALFNSAYNNVMEKEKNDVNIDALIDEYELKTAKKDPLFVHLNYDALKNANSPGGEKKGLKCYWGAFIRIWVEDLKTNDKHKKTEIKRTLL